MECVYLYLNPACCIIMTGTAGRAASQVPTRIYGMHYCTFIYYELYCGRPVGSLAVNKVYHQNRCHKLGPHYKRVVSDMWINCNNVLRIKFLNKCWEAKSAGDYLKVIWQSLAAQDLLWNLILKTLLPICCMFVQYFFINMFH